MKKYFIFAYSHLLNKRYKNSCLKICWTQIMYLILLLFLVSCYSKDPEKTVHKGEALPHFNLFLTDSSTYFNTANLPVNKPVVFFYFGPHCPYSSAQMDDITSKMKKLENIQFVVLTTAPFLQMKRFYEKHKMGEFPNVITGLDYENFFVHYFKNQSVPFLAIYGRDQRLKDAFEGQMPVWQIKEVAES